MKEPTESTLPWIAKRRGEALKKVLNQKGLSMQKLTEKLRPGKPKEQSALLHRLWAANRTKEKDRRLLDLDLINEIAAELKVTPSTLYVQYTDEETTKHGSTTTAAPVSATDRKELAKKRGAKIRSAMKAKGMTQTALMRQLQSQGKTWTRSTIGKYSSGKHFPSAAFLTDVAPLLGKTFDQLKVDDARDLSSSRQRKGSSPTPKPKPNADPAPTAGTPAAGGPGKPISFTVSVKELNRDVPVHGIIEGNATKGYRLVMGSFAISITAEEGLKLLMG